MPLCRLAICQTLRYCRATRVTNDGYTLSGERSPRIEPVNDPMQRPPQLALNPTTPAGGVARCPARDTVCRKPEENLKRNTKK